MLQLGPPFAVVSTIVSLCAGGGIDQGLSCAVPILLM